MMKSSEPIDGHGEILVAGEPEWRTETKRRREGIPLPGPLWERLSAIALQLKVIPPEPDMTD
jgi:LDH2 family malate/lactate/ureidoglycolate dehydrogenase